MPVDVVTLSARSARRYARHAALLTGVSLAALLLAIPAAQARPLNAYVSQPSAAAVAAAQAAQQAAAQAANNSLKRATLAIQARQASQQAAREAAAAALSVTASGIASGLRPGGLQVAPGATPGSGLWQGAELPTEFTDGARTKVTVAQTQQQAILTWQTFNISENTDLRFDQQGNRSWVALNRVLDNIAPSRILGTLKADGSVYVVNRNGIIFGGTSQVNVGALIASTANITNEQFLAKGIYSAQSGSTYAPSFTDAGGAVKVEAGAIIQTHVPADLKSGGGFVLLMGKEVENAGSISTPFGQTQLAAGDGFILRRGYSTDGNSFSTTRGNEIAMLFDAVSGSGTVTNSGLIFSQQGDITLAGRTIRQDGVAISTTSVNTRGTIHLLNAATDAVGSITLGGDSVTSILVELDSNETALNSQRDALIAQSATQNALRFDANFGQFNNLSKLSDRMDQSRVEIVTGGDVVFKNGSLTTAQGGQVAVSAGRIVAENGSVVDVSGVRDVLLPMSANNISVNIQGNELRDSPQNRDSGFLQNQNVWIDLRDLIFVPSGTGGYTGDRYYTPGGLLEVGGHLANTSHKIGEWASVGGTITLSAQQVTAETGSRFDISGGSVAYQAGYIYTSNFLGKDGRLYNINNASADMTYYGLGNGFVRKNERWGITQVWTGMLTKGRVSRRWEEGYTVGRDAGRLLLSTPTAVFEGTIAADVIQGERQHEARPDGVTDGYKLAQNTVAQAGTLALGQYTAVGRSGVYNTNVVIADFAAQPPPADRTNTAWFDADYLNAQGLGAVDFATGGKIKIDAPLSVADGGSVTLIAPIVDISADITARSGSITATNHFPAAGRLSTEYQLLTLQGASTITLAEGVTLDVRGLWVNAVNDRAAYGKQAFLDGGDVTLMSSGDVIVAKNSLIDVSSGGGIFGEETKGGRGGNVTLRADAVIIGEASKTGRLTLDGDIRGYGVEGGGTLTLASGATVVLGGEVLDTNGVLGAGETAPVDLKALDEFRVRAGDILPADYIRVFTLAPAGQAVGGVPKITTVNPVTLGADWTPPRPTVPNGGYSIYYYDSVTRTNKLVTIFTSSGTVPTIPAGSRILSLNNPAYFPQDYVVPVSVFPNGIPIEPKTVTITAGNPAPNDVVFAAGTIIRAGTVVDTSVRVAPMLYLPPGIVRRGFSKYEIVGNTGLYVAPGTQLDVTMPVYRVSSASFSVSTGVDPAAAMEVWTPPLYVDNPVRGRFTQRGGADLSLTSAGGMVLAEGSGIKVDDGHSVVLNALGQLTVEAAIAAPAGTITIGSDLGSAYQQTGIAGQSIWIGDRAVLDVSARSVSGVDINGHRYGIVRDGGSINIGVGAFTLDSKGILQATQSFVIIRPSAILEASGTRSIIDLLVGAGANATWQPVEVASSGGSILIASQTGLYVDGTLHAASGGASAAGGSLTLALETPSFYSAVTATGPRVFTITQERVASALPSNLGPRAADTMLVDGRANVSGSQITEGGFDNVALWSRDIFRFEGNVSLSARQSLAFYRGALTVAPTTPDARVYLSAPYVLLDGAVDPYIESGATYPGLQGGWQPSDTNRGTLRVTADLIDIRNRVVSGIYGNYQTGILPDPIVNRSIDAPGFASVELVSRGDVRFGSGALASGGNITIEAAQLYPMTGAIASIAAGMTKYFQSFTLGANGVLTIRGNGTNPDLPQSVFGTLALLASTIDQGGIIRAPLGSIVLGDVGLCTGCFAPATPDPQPPISITLRNGSITSTSAAGLVVPYGGTTDGLTYKYAGSDVAFAELSSVTPPGKNPIGVTLKGARIVGEPGSVLDLSGGGELAGAAFISGRGGSVDVRETPLVNANPANSYSKVSNRVYALVPGYASRYAPRAPDNGAGDPLVGQQITLTQPVGGLPAGTYTLMPSTYALLPGAYRVEIGGTTTAAFGSTALGNGSYVTTAALGIANTGIHSSLPYQIILTPAEKVRTYSQYNETSYSDFALANAATFGLVRPRLPIDGQVLKLDFGTATGDVLSFDGTALMAADKGGRDGVLLVTAIDTSPLASRPPSIEIRSANAVATAGMASINAEDLSRFKVGTLLIGGQYVYYSGVGDTTSQGARIFFSAAASNVYVRDGVVLEAGQIFLVAKDAINIQGGAVLDTTRGSTNVMDSSDGYVFANSLNGNFAGAGAILAVANGWFNFLPPTTSAAGTVTVDDGASLRTLGTIAVSSSRGLNLGAAVKLNARYLTLSLPEINIGTDASLAAASSAGVLGSGWLLTQSTLDRLLAPGDLGLARVERLTLTVGSSLNLFGNVTLDARSRNGEDTVLALNTPAVYGWGTQSDVATLAVDTLIWNGISSGVGTSANPFVSLPPGAVRPGGAGTGHGTLTVDAREIVFGYDPYTRKQNDAALDRLALGFATVNLSASSRITAKDRGTLSVYHTGTNAQTYAGGDLNISTPLLTAEAGGYLTYTAGGTITARAPTGGAADTASVSTLGGELHFKGSAVTIDTAIALPSGRLELSATGDITLGDRSRLDLSGRAITFFDVTKYSWGGDLVMQSDAGQIMQAAGSVIDVSAVYNAAGSIEAVALDTNGTFAFGGTLRGTATDGFAAGGFDGRAYTLADFAGLNAKLNDGGFFGTRGFVLKTGDLVVGDEVRANAVNISVDGGSLTFNGKIDASGKKVGTIRLAARDDLVLASTAVLDVHGTVLQTDSYGAPIEASNRGHVELTSAQGTVRLAAGATIDMRSPDNVARGQLEINAQRRGGAGGTGDGANDIAIDAGGPLNIRGAASIAVNGFRGYEPANGIVNQSLLDTIHNQSKAFIDAAWLNSALLGRLAGLTAYGNAFHLRPGVELTSTGDLTVDGDLDFSGYRYGPNASSSRPGAGEPGVVVMRAGGDLKINGSITDGFGTPPVTPDDGRFPGQTVTLIGGQPAAQNIEFTAPYNNDWGYNVYLFPSANTGVNFPVVVSGQISDDFFVYGPGDTINDGVLYGTVRIAAGTVLSVSGNASEANITYTSTRTGKMWALAPMLPAGSLSWSMRYVAGADLGSANTRAVQPRRTVGDIVLNDPHGTGLDGTQEALSVLRTGTGYLDLVAARDYRQDTLFGVYTAGTMTGGLARSDGGVLGAGYELYEAALNPIGTYFTDHGGDFLLSVGRNLRGRIVQTQYSWDDNGLSSDAENWSWRQQGQWGINFGTYTVGSSGLRLRGFAGIGALGGGNVVLRVGGDAGESSIGDVWTMTSTALSTAIGSSGRIDAGGSVVRSGGGTLTVDIAGRLNPGMNLGFDERLYGDITNLRGDIELHAAAVGTIVATSFGIPETGHPLPRSGDPRPIDTLASYKSAMYGRVTFNLGDGTLTASTRTDLVANVFAVDGLWTNTTGATLFSAGGDINPGGELYGTRNFVPSLSVTVAGGSILLSSTIDLLPSPVGQLEFLAWGSINGKGDKYVQTPGYVGMRVGGAFNYLHANDPEPMRFYAVNGDIANLLVGQSETTSGITTYHVTGKQAWLRAGRDIFNAGGVVMNNNDADISIVSAGRDIIFANFQIAGPGTLLVSAGRNVYQADYGSLISLGSLVPGDQRSGASIVVQAGVGSAGPDYAAIAVRYLNPDNLAEPGVPLADQPGKVAKTYNAELAAWLAECYHFAGTEKEVLSFFARLMPEQQNTFLRQIYFAELRAGGREYNDANSDRAGSYFRGREATATLFPTTDRNGAPINYAGDIIMFGGSGVRTNYGGDIHMIAPGGRIVIGVEATVPPSTAGIITQGQNSDIQIYSKGSVLLGLSRIMTTFGGDILVWSAEGDINAGRGSKTTVVYAPPKRTYDNYGHVTLGAQPPSTGAGIATLQSVPGTPPSDVDLIAPLGTIDAGEAGIRVSGNVNLAALQVLNAANIQVQGMAMGIPTVQAPNVSGALTASSTAGAAAAGVNQSQPRQGTQEQPSIIIVEVLGFGGGEKSESDQQAPRGRQNGANYNPNGMLRILGNGTFTAEQMKELTVEEQSELNSQLKGSGLH